MRKENYKFRDDSEIMEAIKSINYNGDTGKIEHKFRKNSNGSIDHYGYLILKIKGKQWKAHRLAWAKFYNKPPHGVIDHINGNKLDNRIVNLRDVNQSVNVKNTIKKPNKDTGFIGIHLTKNTAGLLAKYTTKYNNKVYRFRDIEDAKNFRKERGLEL